MDDSIRKNCRAAGRATEASFSGPQPSLSAPHRGAAGPVAFHPQSRFIVVAMSASLPAASASVHHAGANRSRTMRPPVAGVAEPPTPTASATVTQQARRVARLVAPTFDDGPHKVDDLRPGSPARTVPPASPCWAVMADRYGTAVLEFAARSWRPGDRSAPIGPYQLVAVPRVMVDGRRSCSHRGGANPARRTRGGRGVDPAPNLVATCTLPIGVVRVAGGNT